MKKQHIPLFYWRRSTQLLCFALFLFLFIKTDYSGKDELTYAVNLLFRIDPLLAICASLAAGTVIMLMFPSLLTLLLTFLLGRSFCGWVCPMGALLDSCHKIIPPRRADFPARFRPFKYYLLGFLLAGSLFGFSVAGYIDPFSILVRGLTLAVYPAINALNTTFFTFTYQQAPAWVNAVTEPIYDFLKMTVLPFHQKQYDLALLSFTVLLIVLLLERLERRFFCRNVCPLGALLAFVARFSPLKGHAGAKCGTCRNCQDVCRMSTLR